MHTRHIIYITSMPISRTLRVLTWTSLATVEKSVVQNTTKSFRPSGWTKFSSFSRDLFCFNFRSTEFGSIERKAGINVSSYIWCFGGRFNGAPIVTRNLCISGCNSSCEEYAGGEGKDSTVVEHLPQFNHGWVDTSVLSNCLEKRVTV